MKVMTWHILLCLLALPFSQKAFSQAILAGEICPDFPIKNVLYSSDTSLRLSSFKGKLVIIDFWATSCTTCLQSFHELDSLQETFKKDIVILAVTSNPKTLIDPFFKKRNERHKFRIVTDDTLLQKYFPYASMPHVVWINKSGQLQFTTSKGYLSFQNVSKLIKGGNISVIEKKDKINFIPDEFIGSNPDMKASCFVRSAITPALPGVGCFSSPVQGRNRFQGINVTLSDLYSAALNMDRDFSYNRLILLTKDSLRFKYPPGNLVDEWSQKNLLCYDITVDSIHIDKLQELMLSELTAYFGYIATVEERDTTCLILRRTSLLEKYKNKGEQPANYVTDESGRSVQRYLRNWPLSFLTHLLRLNVRLPYLVDETGIKENVTLEFFAPLDNIPALSKDLRKYDLEIVYGKRKIPFVVIRDKPAL